MNIYFDLVFSFPHRFSPTWSSILVVANCTMTRIQRKSTARMIRWAKFSEWIRSPLKMPSTYGWCLLGWGRLGHGPEGLVVVLGWPWWFTGQSVWCQGIHHQICYVCVGWGRVGTYEPCSWGIVLDMWFQGETSYVSWYVQDDIW